MRRGEGSDSDRQLLEQMDEVLLLSAGHVLHRRVSASLSSLSGGRCASVEEASTASPETDLEQFDPLVVKAMAAAAGCSPQDEPIGAGEIPPAGGEIRNVNQVLFGVWRKQRAMLNTAVGALYKSHAAMLNTPLATGFGVAVAWLIRLRCSGDKILLEALSHAGLTVPCYATLCRQTPAPRPRHSP